jgi:hypothetical protein
MEVAYSSHLFAGGLDQFADSGTVATVAFAGFVCEPGLFENAPWVLGPDGALDPCLVRYPFGISGEVGIGNATSVNALRDSSNGKPWIGQF